MISRLQSATDSLTGTLLTGGISWFPEQASSVAGDVDTAFEVVFWICLVFFILIVGLMLTFVFKYRHREGHKPGQTANHNTTLEMVWSIIPTALLVVMFFYGVIGFQGFINPDAASKKIAEQGGLIGPAPADWEGEWIGEDGFHEINVVGKQWSWSFSYGNGAVDRDLHLPLNVPVKLIMTSDDVVHSFFVPEFRFTYDVVPGRYNKVYFSATKAGKYTLLCREYCGTGHSMMYSPVIVYEDVEKYGASLKAIKELKGGPPELWGAHLYRTNGCGGCHDNPATAPSLKGIWNKREKMADGSTVTVDHNYIRESLINPRKRVVAGYTPLMSPYNNLSSEDINALIAYIKSIKNE